MKRLTICTLVVISISLSLGTATVFAVDEAYVVQPGDTLLHIAARHDVSVSQLASANGLRWNSWIYVGQQLTIPGQAGPSAPQDASRERWIDVNLSTQTLTAYVGNSPVYRAAVSTGLPGTPTPAGTFRIWTKLRYDDMSGPGYYLPNVSYVLYSYKDYRLHGTCWHSSFGTPMSHGCVNLLTPEAGWLYNWASVGTQVVVHH